jgi:hypothetical protein
VGLVPVVARRLLARQEIDARQSEAVKAKSGSRQNDLNSGGFRFLELIVDFRVTQSSPESARTARDQISGGSLCHFGHAHFIEE